MVLNTGIKLLPPFQNMLLKKTLQPGENKGIYIAIPVLNRYPHRRLPPLLPGFQIASPRRTSQAPAPGCSSLIHGHVLGVVLLGMIRSCSTPWRLLLLHVWTREDDDNMRTTAPPQIRRSAAPAQLHIQCSSSSASRSPVASNMANITRVIHRSSSLRMHENVIGALITLGRICQLSK